MNDDGTGLRPLDGAAAEFVIGLSWVPDGRTLSVVTTPKGDDIHAGIMYTMDPLEGALELLFAFHGFQAPQWSPDGTVMAFTDNPDILEFGENQVYLLDAGSPLGSARQLTASGVPHRSPTWSPDGTRLAYVTTGGGPGELDDRIIVRTISDSTETPIVDFPDIFGITWSPDGTTLAFDGTPDGNDFQIFKVPASGGPVRQLTRGSAVNGSPTWSPDGQRIAFTSSRDFNNEIYVMNADGSDQTRLTNNPAQDSNPAWRP
jgi:Tol biopolymer transport system component